MYRKIKIINLLLAIFFLLPNVASACSYIEDINLWSNCEDGIQVALEPNIVTIPGDFCPSDAVTTRTCGVYDGVCSVGFMSDYHGGYLKANNVKSVMPDNSVFYNFDSSEYYLNSNDLNGEKFKTDMANIDILVVADSEPKSRRWTRASGTYWDFHYLNAIKPAYNNGMSIMASGDHSACMWYGCTYADDMVAPMVSNLQSSFTWGGFPGKVSHRVGRMGSTIPFFDGLYYATNSIGLHTPGNIIRRSGSPDTCLKYVSGKCLFGYIEPSGGKGWLTFSGNVGFSTYDSLSGDTTSGASIFDAIADCSGGESIGLAPFTSLSSDPSIVASGDSSTLNWTVTNNPTSCVASGDWSGEKIGLFSEVIDNITSEKNFSLQCANEHGPGNIAFTSVNVLDCRSIPALCSIPSNPDVNDFCVNATSFIIPPTENINGNFEWTCGYETELSKVCTALKQIDEVGICGSAKNGKFNSLDEGNTNLCSSGVVTNFNTTSDGWSWDCNGICAESGNNEIGCNAIKTNSANWIEVAP